MNDILYKNKPKTCNKCGHKSNDTQIETTFPGYENSYCMFCFTRWLDANIGKMIVDEEENKKRGKIK